MRLLLCLALLLGTAGCGVLDRFGVTRAKSDQVLPFRTRLSHGEDRRDMVIAVTAGSAGVEQVRESVRYAATRHCLLGFGQSETDWLRGPSGDWAAQRDGGTLIFRGRCTGR